METKEEKDSYTIGTAGKPPGAIKVYGDILDEGFEKKLTTARTIYNRLVFELER